MAAGALGGLALAGCGGLSQDPANAATELARFPGTEQQIRSYYTQNASEYDFSCNSVTMGPIDRVKVVEETASALSLAIRYAFGSQGGVSQGGRRGTQGSHCAEGWGSRIVTFKKEGQGWALVRMSGETRG